MNIPSWADFLTVWVRLDLWLFTENRGMECVWVCITGVYLNSGHDFVCRFRFCCTALLCALDGNPSNTARILIKSNNILVSSAIEACRLWGDPWRTERTWQVMLHSTVAVHVGTKCFVCSHRDKSDKGPRIIGLMLECVAISCFF